MLLPVRADGRQPGESRPVEIVPGYVGSALGSALISVGGTRVICTASIDDDVPRWRRGSGAGWLTAEYGMLPASTGSRRPRDVTRGRPDGRTTEIQRLIGRSIRAVVDLGTLGERTVWIDCDVLEADGGTRCASICGAWVALARAIDRLVADGSLEASPLRGPVSAVSVGITDGNVLLDLPYAEDSTADVDVNVVMDSSDRLIEVHASAEGQVFSREELDQMLDFAAAGISRLRAAQLEAAGAA
jgi:ribonuclease PH